MELISIAAGSLGAKFLEEAVGFLWSEAGKILDRYHKRQAEPSGDGETSDIAKRLGMPESRVIDLAAAEERREEIRTLMKDLALVANGVEPVDSSDEEFLAKLDRLQALVATVYGDPSGLIATAKVRAERVAQGGEVVGVDAARVDQGRFDGDVEAGTVEGKAIGVRIDNR